MEGKEEKMAMEIVVKTEPKEIAALVTALQERQSEPNVNHFEAALLREKQRAAERAKRKAGYSPSPESAHS